MNQLSNIYCPLSAFMCVHVSTHACTAWVCVCVCVFVFVFVQVCSILIVLACFSPCFCLNCSFTLAVLSDCHQPVLPRLFLSLMACNSSKVSLLSGALMPEPRCEVPSFHHWPMVPCLMVQGKLFK